MKEQSLLLLLTVCFAFSAARLQCSKHFILQDFEGCAGSVNELPLIDVAPTLVGTVRTGEKYTYDYDGRLFYVLVLYGSPYDMGYGQGQLMKEELSQEIPLLLEYAKSVYL